MCIYFFLEKNEKSVCNSSLECKATLQCRNNHCACCELDFWNGILCDKSKDYVDKKKHLI